MDERAASFAATLGITDGAVLHAFATTPRHLFLPRMAADDVYRDDALPTRWDGDRPTSSSTQPSLMAQMIELLALAPGMRVLEIGAGTGYNAALVHRITGAPVVSLDMQADVVTDARAALERAGIADVLVVHGDGYAGHPAGGPYDRIIVTCGIRGVPPGWLDQLTGGGFVIAPLAHGGLHPIVRVQRDGRVRVRSGRAGFMHAAGGLYPVLPDDFPPPIGERPPAAMTRSIPPMDGEQQDFWFGAAALDRRMTRADAAHGWIPALVEDACRHTDGAGDPNGSSAAWFVRDAILAGGPGAAALLDDAAALVERWSALGCPPATAWTASLDPADVDPPLLVTPAWHLEGGSPS